MLKITFKSDQIIVSHSKQTILYHQVRQAFSQEFQVQIKIKSGGLHPIFKSNQVKSESSDLDFKSNQIDLIWFDFRSFQSDLCSPTYPRSKTQNLKPKTPKPKTQIWNLMLHWNYEHKTFDKLLPDPNADPRSNTQNLKPKI